MPMPKEPKFQNCLVCGVTFQKNAPNHKLCKKHTKQVSKKCLKCEAQFWTGQTGNKRAGLYCGRKCYPKKTYKPKPKPPELKEPIILTTGRPKGSTAERSRIETCAVCATPLHSKNYTQVYCSEHRYFHKKHCRYCKEAFHSPKAEKQVYCQETCRLNDQKPCQVCGVYFQPLTRAQIYCETHNKGGPEANKYSIHWKAGAPASVGNPKDNPYKAGTIKACEATEKHVDCSGTMMVFANEWTRCIHCAKMLTRQSESISHVRDF